MNDIDEERCPALHNPGTWPYVARCVLTKGHRTDYHEDKDGWRWRQPKEVRQ